MRLQTYYKYWQQVYDSNIEKSINETIDLTTIVKRKNENEWYFWVDNDMYIVRTTPRRKNTYHLSFAYVDYFDDEQTDITNKHTPFSVMDGVAVVMKNLIEEKHPEVIEYVVINVKKKVEMFKNITAAIIRKHPNIFGIYKLKTRKADTLPYELPPELGHLEGIEIRLEKEGKT